MRANLESTDGLIASEAVAMALAGYVGRSDAHGIVEVAARRARERGSTLVDALAADPAVTRYLTREDLERHLSPDRYVAAARAIVERVIGQTPQDT
jgi:3-carboxy-cis,cis-muconate cycloisomerase